LEEKKMTRKLSTFLSLVFGSILLASAGCEDAATKAALATCNTNYENLQKSSSAQAGSLSQLKTELTQAQAKVQELTKENDQLKATKTGKVEASASKSSAHKRKK
jgi:peptidoglycan hydrolase CwlO-like protein